MDPYYVFLTGVFPLIVWSMKIAAGVYVAKPVCRGVEFWLLAKSKNEVSNLTKFQSSLLTVQDQLDEVKLNLSCLEQSRKTSDRLLGPQAATASKPQARFNEPEI
jgi:hypothetical protein